MKHSGYIHTVTYILSKRSIGIIGPHERCATDPSYPVFLGLRAREIPFLKSESCTFPPKILPMESGAT